MLAQALGYAQQPTAEPDNGHVLTPPRPGRGEGRDTAPVDAEPERTETSVGTDEVRLTIPLEISIRVGTPLPSPPPAPASAAPPVATLLPEGPVLRARSEAVDGMSSTT